MPGQRIYYVPPRLVGPVNHWSGMEAPGGASWLIDHAAGLGFNALWFSPMCETTQVEKISHGKKRTGSYYAIRDHFKLDSEFSSGDPAKDLLHLKHFCAQAAAKGMRVYADLVFNHVAADHPLVLEESAAIQDILHRTGSLVTPIKGAEGDLIGISYQDSGEKKDFYLKFRRHDDFSLQVGGNADDPWSDVAPINYSSPEARRFFIEGDQAYFKKVIDWYIDLGFRGFRCDVAYMIPPGCWQELIAHARQKQPDSAFLAETLGASRRQVEKLAEAVITDENGHQRPAFDLGMLSLYWWNMKDAWLPNEEVPRIQQMSRYGGAGCPDNHDTDGTVAGNLCTVFNGQSGADAAVTDGCLRSYALSVLTCNSSYMQMGYEYCNEMQNRVFKGDVSPEKWTALRKQAGQRLDISAQIRAMNALKESLHVENCRAVFKEYGERQGGQLVRLSCEFIDVDTGKKTAEVTLVMKPYREQGAVVVTDSTLQDLEGGGLERMDLQGLIIYHTPIEKSPAPKQKPGVPAKPKP